MKTAAHDDKLLVYAVIPLTPRPCHPTRGQQFADSAHAEPPAAPFRELAPRPLGPNAPGSEEVKSSVRSIEPFVILVPSALSADQP
jgi:hypothetical protein